MRMVLQLEQDSDQVAQVIYLEKMELQKQQTMLLLLALVHQMTHQM